MAVFNTATMLGVFVLARRLSGSFAGGLVALVLAAVYPTFSVQTGRLYPDPLTTALLVWAAATYAGAVTSGSRRRMAVAAALLGLALLVRSQVLEYMVAVIAVALLVSAPRWWRRPDARGLVVAFLIGLAPSLVVWGAIRWAVGSRDDVVRMGQVTFRPTYPFGFWQQLETDGWTGPYRFKQDPFYKDMEAEARAGDPDLLRSRAKQAAFTVRYVAARPVTSLLLVLDNAYRLSTTGRRTTTSGTIRTRTPSRSPSSAWSSFSGLPVRPGSWPSMRPWPACSSSPSPWPSFTAWCSPGRATTCRRCRC